MSATLLYPKVILLLQSMSMHTKASRRYRKGGEWGVEQAGTGYRVCRGGLQAPG